MTNMILAWLTDPVIVVLISAVALLLSAVAVTISAIAMHRMTQRR